MLKKLKDITLEDIRSIVDNGGCANCTLMTFCTPLGTIYCQSIEDSSVMEAFFDEEIEVPDAR